MPIDRLAELRKNEAYNEQSSSQMETEVGPIVQELEKIRKLSRQLEEYQDLYLADNDKRTMKRIDKTVNELNKEALVAKDMITRMNDETKRLAARGADRSALEMRSNQFHHLSTKLVEVTKGAWDMQNSHQGEVTKQVARRLKIRYTNPDGTTTMGEDDAQQIAKKLVETGNQDQIFSLARDELEKALDMRDAAVDLERDMRQLYQLFCDMNVLIVEQGEGIEDVTSKVHKAESNMQSGNKQLKLAKKYQKDTCCLAM